MPGRELALAVIADLPLQDSEARLAPVRLPKALDRAGGGSGRRARWAARAASAAVPGAVQLVEEPVKKLGVARHAGHPREDLAHRLHVVAERAGPVPWGLQGPRRTRAGVHRRVPAATGPLRAGGVSAASRGRSGAPRGSAAVVAPGAGPCVTTSEPASHCCIRGTSPVPRSRWGGCSGRRGRRAARGGRRVAHVTTYVRVGTRLARRRAQPAVLPVDVLGERDARDAGDEGGETPRLAVRDDDSLELFARGRHSVDRAVLDPDLAGDAATASGARNVGLLDQLAPAPSQQVPPRVRRVVGDVPVPARRVHAVAAPSTRAEPGPLLSLHRLVLAGRAHREVPRLRLLCVSIARLRGDRP